MDLHVECSVRAEALRDRNSEPNAARLSKQPHSPRHAERRPPRPGVGPPPLPCLASAPHHAPYLASTPPWLASLPTTPPCLVSVPTYGQSSSFTYFVSSVRDSPNRRSPCSPRLDWDRRGRSVSSSDDTGGYRPGRFPLPRPRDTVHWGRGEDVRDFPFHFVRKGVVCPSSRCRLGCRYINLSPEGVSAGLGGRGVGHHRRSPWSDFSTLFRGTGETCCRLLGRVPCMGPVDPGPLSVSASFGREGVRGRVGPSEFSGTRVGTPTSLSTVVRLPKFVVFK